LVLSEQGEFKWKTGKRIKLIKSIQLCFTCEPISGPEIPSPGIPNPDNPCFAVNITMSVEQLENRIMYVQMIFGIII
jgi:hypothetical protein